MPMRFLVGRELPRNITSISLSYALFDVTAMVDGAELASVTVKQPAQAGASRPQTGWIEEQVE